jgi:methyltransferase
MMRLLILGAVAFVPMLLEARRSRRNEAALRALGAVEPAGDVYRIMQVAYPSCFLAMMAEASTRPAAGESWVAAGTVLFGTAKLLKYWAIGTLGPRWTFRVLVPPGAARIADGPYRWMRHPNYVGVAGEIAGYALLAGTPLTGTAAGLVFGGLMFARVKVEEHALDACEQ